MNPISGTSSGVARDAILRRLTASLQRAQANAKRAEALANDASRLAQNAKPQRTDGAIAERPMWTAHARFAGAKVEEISSSNALSLASVAIGTSVATLAVASPSEPAAVANVLTAVPPSETPR